MKQTAQNAVLLVYKNLTNLIYLFSENHVIIFHTTTISAIFCHCSYTTGRNRKSWPGEEKKLWDERKQYDTAAFFSLRFCSPWRQ